MTDWLPPLQPKHQAILPERTASDGPFVPPVEPDHIPWQLARAKRLPLDEPDGATREWTLRFVGGSFDLRTNTSDVIATPDGRVVVTWDRQERLRLFELATGREIRVIPTDTTPRALLNASYFPAPDRLVMAIALDFADSLHELLEVDLAAGAVADRRALPTGDVVALTPDFMVMSDSDSFWTVRNEPSSAGAVGSRCPRPEPGGPCRFVQPDPLGQWVAVPGASVTVLVNLADAGTGPVELGADFAGTAWSPDGSLLIAVTADGLLHAIERHTWKTAWTHALGAPVIPEHDRWPGRWAGATRPIGIATNATNRGGRIALRTRSQIGSITFGSEGNVTRERWADASVYLFGTPRPMVFVPGHDRLLLEGHGSMIARFDSDTLEPIPPREDGHVEEANSVVVSEDGRYLASTGLRDSRVLVHDTTGVSPRPRSFTGNQLLSLPGAEHATLCDIDLSADGSRMVVGFGHGEVVAYRILGDGGEPVLEPLSSVAHDDCVMAVAISPDGTMAASCGYDFTHIVWRVADGTIVKRPQVENMGVTLQFTADGQVLHLWDQDGKFFAFHGHTGKPVRDYPQQEPLAYCEELAARIARSHDQVRSRRKSRNGRFQAFGLFRGPILLYEAPNRTDAPPQTMA